MDANQHAVKGIKSTRHGNILAARIIADTVRSTLGPRGMDKVLVDEFNNIIVTNDGATILRDLQTDHPIARMISEIALSQETEVGDGTTSAVLIAGELLKNAEQLLDSKIHPTIIAKGYKIAAVKSQELLKTYAKSFVTNSENLLHIAKTAMTGKSAEFDSDLLAKLCVDAVLHVVPSVGVKAHISAIDKTTMKIKPTKASSILSKIQVIAQKGGTVFDSVLHKGYLVDKIIVHDQMPKTLTSAKIALLSCALELRETEIQSRISIKSPEQLDLFLQQEEQTIQKLVQSLIDAKADIVMTSKGIDDLAMHYLSKAGIAAVRRVKPSDLSVISQLTGAQVSNSLESVVLGTCDMSIVEINSQKYTLVSNTPNSQSASILVSASTPHISDELARAIDDALGDLCSVLEQKLVVGGAGCIEIQLATDLRTYAKTFSGREQLAIESFAKSLEVIPRTLAENAGLDPIDILVGLYANLGKGVCIDGGLIDVFAQQILEPVAVKSKAIHSASEVASLVLRVDDIILPPPETQMQSSQKNQKMPQLD
jgi:archaeal chaperonin